MTVVDPKGPRWRGYLVSRTAIIHGGADRVGNVVPFNTEEVAVPGRGLIKVPCVSGNSIRHGLREAAAHMYLSLLREEGGPPVKLPPKLYYVLFSGGANQGGDGGHFDFDERAEVMRMIPPIAVFGTARDGGTFAGAVYVSSAQPASRETWDLILPPRPTDAWPCGAVAADALAERVWLQKHTSALRMLADRQYTRTDALRVRSPEYVSIPEESAEEPAVDKKGKKGKTEKASPHQMIYTYQTLVKGVAMVHEVGFLQPADALTASCFGAVLGSWAAAPTIGGRAALGHGLVDAHYDRPFADGREYQAYIRDNRTRIRQYLADKWGAVLG